MTELYFGYGKVEGFTSIKLADKKNGFAIPIRELLQNSLDASRSARNECCEINIYLESINKKDIPHIKKYEEVLEKSIETLRRMDSYNKQSEQVVAYIKEALKKDVLDILIFVDNGVGMKQKTLEGLIDERSIKSDESSGGSYGVGHLSSYFLSSLRYILYATKYKENNNIKQLFTGLPILAGHADNKAKRISQGIILEKPPDNQAYPIFKFSTDFPEFIQPKMDNLKSTGTAVVILGLSESWSNEAEYAIASNFFHAMIHDSLSVKIHKNNEVKTIGEYEVNELIAQKKEGKRALEENILSGNMIYQACEAVKMRNSQKSINLKNNDKVPVYIKNDIDSNSSIVLIRNGMLVARHDSMLSDDMDNLRRNPDFQSFVAVIDVDMKDSPQLFELVKGAENPYHNKLKSKILLKDNEKKLKGLFKELSEEIKIHLKEIDRTGFDLPLFDMPIKGDIKGGTNSNPLPRSIGKQKPEKPPSLLKPPKICPDCEQVPCICPKPEPRPTPEINLRQLESRNATRYIDKGKTLEVRMRIKPTKQPDSKDNAYFSIALAEDNDNNKVSEFVVFESLRINNNELLKDKFMRENSQINLGQLNEADTYDIVATILKPHNFGNVKVALKPSFGLKQKQENNNE